LRSFKNFWKQLIDFQFGGFQIFEVASTILIFLEKENKMDFLNLLTDLFLIPVMCGVGAGCFLVLIWRGLKKFFGG
jgi:hypothetical protein